MKRLPKNVDEYMRTLGPEALNSLEVLRQVIVDTVPEAKETMHNQMPTYEIGKPLCSFAAQKRYLAFYVCDSDILESFRPRFENLNLGKGCIRFRAIEQVPDRALRALLRMGARRLLKAAGG